eukprot:GHVU01083617.1.p1 GENE.GHVU01083617.1~~GHVU01083617.1.p1  ORF type:complete len:115 (-),score=8.57 GHVU01083617.1:148-492(-)
MPRCLLLFTGAPLPVCLTMGGSWPAFPLPASGWVSHQEWRNIEWMKGIMHEWEMIRSSTGMRTGLRGQECDDDEGADDGRIGPALTHSPHGRPGPTRFPPPRKISKRCASPPPV